jgi:outer membrane protein TolC
MFGMHEGIRSGLLRSLTAALVLAVHTSTVFASGLSLEAAETMALEDDPGVRMIQSNRQALAERSVAAEQFPDPMVKMGLMSLPTDSFQLGQEPMTQVQVGVVQKFPRGKSRELRAQRLGQKSEGLDAAALDQALQITLAVREQYLEVLKQKELARINAGAIEAFSEVVDITRDYYSSGRVQQQDVLQAAVELAKVEDRATRIAQDEEQARTRLATWIGDAAFGELETGWPAMRALTDDAALEEALPIHPRIVALQKNVTASETAVELARQRYKPEFGVDLTYGGRGGHNPDGSSRADLLSLMVVMDVPLFTKNRQDRVVAAQVAESSAAMYARDDVLRRMRSEIDYHVATYRRQRERIELFETTLLPDAEFSSEASMNAYRSSIADLTQLLRSRITEFDLQLEHARLEAEILKTQARLRYLEGA